MKRLPDILIIIFLFLHFTGCENYDDDPVFPASDFISTGTYQGDYWPTQEWRTCAPDEVGMDPVKLKELNEEIRLLLELQVDFRSLIIIKDGYIVAEQYYSEDYGEYDLHRIFSCTKSLTSAMIGIAWDRGLLSGTGQKMIEFFPEYEIQNMSEDKSKITLEHLLTMSAGLEWYEMDYAYGDDRNTYRQWADQGGGIKFVLDLPMIAAPGQQFAYNSGASQVLSGIVQKVSGVRADSFALNNLFTPLGIKDYYWPIDNEGVAYGGSGVRLRPRDMARFGYLYLKNGVWEDEQIIPEAWVEKSQQKLIKRKYIEDSYYGYQFWVSDYGAYSAVGYGGQWITIVPEHNLVMVCNNAFDEGDNTQWNTPERLLITYVIPSLE